MISSKWPESDLDSCAGDGAALTISCHHHPVSEAFFARSFSALMSTELPILVLAVHRDMKRIHHHDKRIARPFSDEGK